jgi:hypothetical protein
MAQGIAASAPTITAQASSSAAASVEGASARILVSSGLASSVAQAIASAAALKTSAGDCTTSAAAQALGQWAQVAIGNVLASAYAMALSGTESLGTASSRSEAHATGFALFLRASELKAWRIHAKAAQSANLGLYEPTHFRVTCQ